MSNNTPRVSVIVCTFNRALLLQQCLDALFEQSIGEEAFDVVVVDNNSTDYTLEIVDKFRQNHANLFYVFEAQQGLSFARNRGCKVAISDYLAYIDDDVTVPAAWLERAISIIEDKRPDIFGGPVFPATPDHSPVWFKEAYYTRGDIGTNGFIKQGHIIGCNFFIRKALLEEYGGFDTVLGMKGKQIGYHEETALVHRAFREKKTVYYSSEIAVYDKIPKHKMHLLFFLYSAYKVGQDGYALWPHKYNVSDVRLLAGLIDEIMDDIAVALLERETKYYPQPENYIVENVVKKFTQLGILVQSLAANIVNTEDQNLSTRKNSKNDRFERCKKHLYHLLTMGLPDSCKLSIDETITSKLLVTLRIHQAYLLKRLGYTQEAFEMIEETLQKDPGHLGLNQTKGVLLASIGCYSEAISVFENNLKQAPERIDILINISDAYRYANDAEQAIHALEKFVSLGGVFKKIEAKYKQLQQKIASK